MNWLGELVQKEISIDDIVLDLGAGIMQAVRGLECRFILACDVWTPYLDNLKREYSTIQINMNELNRFMEESYDVVICLDVLEHLEEKDAIKAIDEMKRICRKKLIIYTPNEFKTNEPSIDDAWGLGHNEYQRHKCVLSNSLLRTHGFIVRNDNEDGGNFGVWLK
mgnify:CR=1 FL=1